MDPYGGMLVREVAPDYNRDWVPAWAKGMPILKIGDKDPPYTYADWLEWPETERPMELLDGLLVTAMSFPTSFHAGIEGTLYADIRNYLKRKKGRVFSSNFAVRLFPDSEKEEDRVTISPDITVVLDPSKINREGCQGAPDFVVEVLSPSSAKNDLVAKFNDYQRAGVGEYWIVNPDTRTVQVNILRDGEYIVRMYGEEKVPSATLPGLEIDFTEAFSYVECE
jgi:Uma2 family endonuclease